MKKPFKPLLSATIRTDGITAFFDGACWPNPGHGAYGAVIKRDGVIVHTVSEYSGPHVSNNCTEYQGLTAILKYLIENSIHVAAVYGDADMVIKQMNGEWKAGTLTKKERKGKVPIKPRLYLPYYREAITLRLQLPSVTVEWIRRDLNEEADELSTRPLRERGLRDTRYQRPQNESEYLDERFAAICAEINSGRPVRNRPEVTASNADVSVQLTLESLP